MLRTQKSPLRGMNGKKRNRLSRHVTETIRPRRYSRRAASVLCGVLRLYIFQVQLFRGFAISLGGLKPDAGFMID